MYLLLLVTRSVFVSPYCNCLHCTSTLKITNMQFTIYLICYIEKILLITKLKYKKNIQFSEYHRKLNIMLFKRPMIYNYIFSIN